MVGILALGILGLGGMLGLGFLSEKFEKEKQIMY